MSHEIEAAVLKLREGGVVAFPTETVYGLGADASNPVAVRRIFDIKGRPANHPLIVHLADVSQVPDWARAVPPELHLLARHFWPGPLTVILPRGNAPLAVTGGQDSVGVRVPHHPVALALLEAFGGGIAAPSANRFGRVSPTRAIHVAEELQGDVDLILEGGDCDVGLESTIVSLVGDEPLLLRPGAIGLPSLEAVLGRTVSTQQQTENIRAPGMLESHYAPTTPLYLSSPSTLHDRLAALLTAGKRVALMRIQSGLGQLSDHPLLLTLAMPDSADTYGKALYAALRQLDQSVVDVIVVERPPIHEVWAAVNDRLRRASHGHQIFSESGTLTSTFQTHQGPGILAP
ncbi:MAG: L-threonylcarbamoyladenylate synthase [Methylococcaceae bacterium]|jgi:L-threonylcarbamoyladenylate synthase